MTKIIRQIPLRGTDRYLELVRPECGEWELREIDGGVIRPLNSYENKYVNSTYAAVWNRPDAERDMLRAQVSDLSLSLDALVDTAAMCLHGYVDPTDGGNKAHWILGAINRAVCAVNHLGGIVEQHNAAVDKVASLAGLAVQSHDVSEYDLGLANGLLMALATLRGNEYEALTRPTYWRHAKPTLRETYREMRKTEKPLPAALLAFFKWAD